MNRRQFLHGAMGACGAPLFAGRSDAQGTRTRLILLGTGGGPTPKKSVSAPAQVIVINGAASRRFELRGAFLQKQTVISIFGCALVAIGGRWIPRPSDRHCQVLSCGADLVRPETCTKPDHRTLKSPWTTGVTGSAGRSWQVVPGGV